MLNHPFKMTEDSLSVYLDFESSDSSCAAFALPARNSNFNIRSSNVPLTAANVSGDRLTYVAGGTGKQVIIVANAGKQPKVSSQSKVQVEMKAFDADRSYRIEVQNSTADQSIEIDI